MQVAEIVSVADFFSPVLLKPQKPVYTQKTQLPLEWKKALDFNQPTFSWSKTPMQVAL